MYRIGYIDEDPDQIKKYRRDLRKHFDIIDYKISKGLSIENLIDQVYQSEIDLLMVDYLLVDKGILPYNGDEVIRRFEEIKPRFPMIIFTHNENQAFPKVDNPNYIYDKSTVDDINHFVEKVTKTIDLYKNYIKKRKDLISELIEKGEKVELNATEKNNLFEAQLELSSLDKRSKEVPLQLLEEKKVERLSKMTKEAEEYLESLIKKTAK